LWKRTDRGTAGIHDAAHTTHHGANVDEYAAATAPGTTAATAPGTTAAGRAGADVAKLSPATDNALRR
jgi:hypothetical protein